MCSGSQLTEALGELMMGFEMSNFTAIIPGMQDAVYMLAGRMACTVSIWNLNIGHLGHFEYMSPVITTCFLSSLRSSRSMS